MQGPPATGAPSDAGQPIRIMVVDDSAVVRGLITRILEAHPDLKVVSSVGDGLMALSAIGRHEVDVIVLDVEMPRMDGLTALPKLVEARPGVKVVMASTLTRRNAEISLRALELGAADYIPKPSSSGGIHSGEEFKRELVEKIRALVPSARRRSSLASSASSAGGASATVQRPLTAARAATPAPMSRPPADLKLRPLGSNRPDVIAIGSSTGGPQALQKVLGGLSPAVTAPILVTQHMPATFTTILAEHVGRASGRPCKEASDGDIVRPGHIYIAPGNYHMGLERRGVDVKVRLNQDPPENFCRPSVDFMLREVVKVYGGRSLVVILTGMGQDGAKECAAVVQAGGTVIAQDEESSVVWGMPGAVATRGLCSAIVPLSAIATRMGEIVKRAAA